MRRKGARRDDERYDLVVLVCFGRSGSTVLQRVLNDLPGVEIRGENLGATRHLFRASAALTEAHHRYAKYRRQRADDPWFGVDRIDPDAVFQSLRHFVVENILQPSPGTSVTGFKEIRYTPSHYEDFAEFLAHLQFLDDLFPGTRYVFNTRSVETAARSGWWPQTPDALEVLTVADEWFRRAPAILDAHFGATRCLLLDYDRWSGDPRELVRLAEFVGGTLSIDRASELLAKRLSHARHRRSAPTGGPPVAGMVRDWSASAPEGAAANRPPRTTSP